MKFSKKSLSIALAASTLFAVSPSMFEANAMISEGAPGVSTPKGDSTITPGCFIKPKGVRKDTWGKLFGAANAACCVTYGGQSYYVPYLVARVGDESRIKFDNYHYNMSREEREALLSALEPHINDDDLSGWERYDAPHIAYATLEHTDDPYVFVIKNSISGTYMTDIGECVTCLRAYLDKEAKVASPTSAIAAGTAKVDATITPGCFIKPKEVSADTWKKILVAANEVCRVTYGGYSYYAPRLQAYGDYKDRVKFDSIPQREYIDFLMALEKHRNDGDLLGWERYSDSDIEAMLHTHATNPNIVVKDFANKEWPYGTYMEDITKYIRCTARYIGDNNFMQETWGLWLHVKAEKPDSSESQMHYASEIFCSAGSYYEPVKTYILCEIRIWDTMKDFLKYVKVDASLTPCEFEKRLSSTFYYAANHYDLMAEHSHDTQKKFLENVLPILCSRYSNLYGKIYGSAVKSVTSSGSSSAPQSSTSKSTSSAPVTDESKKSAVDKGEKSKYTPSESITSLRMQRREFSSKFHPEYSKGCRYMIVPRALNAKQEGWDIFWKLCRNSEKISLNRSPMEGVKEVNFPDGAVLTCYAPRLENIDFKKFTPGQVKVLRDAFKASPNPLDWEVYQLTPDFGVDKCTAEKQGGEKVVLTDLKEYMDKVRVFVKRLPAIH